MATENQTTENQATDNQTDNQTTDNQTTDNQTAGNQITENQSKGGADTTTPENQSKTSSDDDGKKGPFDPNAIGKHDTPSDDGKKDDDKEDDSFQIEFADDSPIVGDENRKAVVDLVQSLDLTQDQAQGMIDFSERMYRLGEDSMGAGVSAQDERAAQEVLADPNFATAEAREKSAVILNKVATAFGDDRFLQEMRQGSARNSLPLMKFLLKVGEAMKGNMPLDKGDSGGKESKSSDVNDVYLQAIKGGGGGDSGGSSFF